MAYRQQLRSPSLRLLETTNVAVSGSNSIQHLQRIEDLPAHDPDCMGIVVMTTGGNDLIHWYGRSEPREGAIVPNFGGNITDLTTHTIGTPATSKTPMIAVMTPCVEYFCWRSCTRYPLKRKVKPAQRTTPVE